MSQPGPYPPYPMQQAPRRSGGRIACIGCLGLFGFLAIVIGVVAANSPHSSTPAASTTTQAAPPAQAVQSALAAPPATTVAAAPVTTAAAAGAVSSAPKSAPVSSAPAAPADNQPAGTVSEQQALAAAEGYLGDGQGFSRQGLIDQLHSPFGNSFSVADATWAVDHSDANWDAQAVDCAKGYMSDGQGFSRQGLIQQMTSSFGNKFTEAQAEYAADAVGL